MTEITRDIDREELDIMSSSTTPLLVKKQSNEMKLVLSKDARVALKTPSGNSSATPTPIPKSVIREPPPKQDLDSFCDKPIVIPPVPKLISIISKGQSTLAQFFPTKPTPPAPTSNAAPSHTHSTPTHKHRVEELLKTKNLVKHGVSTSSENVSKNRTPPKQGVLVGTDIVHKDNLLKKKSPVMKQGLPTILAKTKSPTAQRVVVGGVGVSDTYPLGTSPTRKRETGSEQSDIRPPKPKRVKTAASTGLPYSRVKTIMKTNIQSSQTTVNTGQESVAVVSKATELFIAELAKRSLEASKEPSIKSVSYTHLAEAVQKSKDLHFLHAVVPRKVLARDILVSHNNTDTTTQH